MTDTAPDPDNLSTEQRHVAPEDGNELERVDTERHDESTRETTVELPDTDDDDQSTAGGRSRGSGAERPRAEDGPSPIEHR